MSKINYDKQFNNSILGGSPNPTSYDTAWEEWNNQSGENVQGFIKNKLENSIVDLEFQEQQLIGKNAFGEKVCETKVEIMQPQYETNLQIVGFKIDGIECSTSGTYAYKDNSKYEVGINLNVGYTTSSWTDIIRKGEVVNIYIGSLHNKFSVTTVTRDNPETYWVDITSLVSKCNSDTLASFSIEADSSPTYLDKDGKQQVMDGTKNATLGNFKIVKLEVTCTTSNLILSDSQISFLVKGVKTNEYTLQYYVNTIQELHKISSSANISYNKAGIDINSNGQVNYTFNSPGVYSIFVRASHKTNTSIVSDWKQYNVIVSQNYTGTPLPIVTDIASEVQNCDTATLFNFAVYPGNGGNTEIISYLSDDVSTLYDNEFKTASYTNIQNTDSISKAFTTYNEFHNLPPEGEQRYLGIKLGINGETYILKSFKYRSLNDTIQVNNFFNFKIVQPESNASGDLQYIDDGSLKNNFNQITLQNNNIFIPSNLDPDLSSSDGYVINDNNTGFKVSAQYTSTSKGLFTTPIDFSNLLESNQGFTIEVQYKTSNCNGDEPVFSIGSLIFGPGYCRLDTKDEDKNSEVSFWKNSKTSYSKDEITHVLVTFERQYMPSTYKDSTYELLFPKYKEKTSFAYNILRIFVNGTINREIRLDDFKGWLSGTKESSNATFNFQIHPISSDVEFYTIRTYTKALNYAEIQKNRISTILNLADKEAYVSKNDILREDGTISLYKAAKKYNVIAIVLPDGSNPDYPAEQPLWYGNRNTEGSGSSAYKKRRRTILVNYKDAENKDDNNEYYSKYSGRYTNFEYKAQGSSAKKYMLAHNVQASKGKWQTLKNIEDVKAGTAEKKTSKTVPIPNCKIEAKKLVGKVNTASSMQSHKIGATKLFNDCWFDALQKPSYTPGNENTRIAVYEDPFLYFYARVPDPDKIKTVWDLCDVTVLGNNKVVVDDNKAQFFGFFTWGSGKADKPQFGYGDDTPEYILVEGADNASPGANFHQPWAAFQCWDSTKRFSDPTQVRKQQPSSVTKKNCFDGLLIDDETLRFEKSTDPWDFDYGCEESEKEGLYYFPKPAQNSVKKFVEFYNAMYEYDYTNFTPVTESPFNLTLEKDSNGNVIDDRNTALRYVIAAKNIVDEKGNKLSLYDVYRYDIISQEFVPAGLHYDEGNNKWETYNIVIESSKFADTALGRNNNISNWTGGIPDTWNDAIYIIDKYKKMYEAAIKTYVDVDSLAYHQAFIRIVSGTDNRAKNTYMAIFGKRYTNKHKEGTEYQVYYSISSDDEYNGAIGYFKANESWEEDRSKFYLKDPVGVVSTINGDTLLVKTRASEETEEVRAPLTDLIEVAYTHPIDDQGDYKIRFMQDDVDTIFETDNNGQQLKPHYLLEPAFDKSTESYWGDNHSSLFYPFDISFQDEINDKTEKLIKYLIGNYSSLMDPNSKFYQYFFSVQEYYPAIAYNHTAEIYYEVPELFYSNGDKNSGYDSIQGFANNSVPYPLSLSHGSCIESEVQFMTDRIKMLGSMTRTAPGLRKNVAISGTDSGGSSSTYTIKMDALFQNYIAPGIAINKSGGTEYQYMLDHTSNKNSEGDSYQHYLNYDSLLNSLSGVPVTLNNFAYPNHTYKLISPSLTSNISNNILDVDTYKEVKITDGLACTSFFIGFTNAAKVEIVNVPNYKIAGTYYKMSNYYPVVEELILNGINFTSGSTTLDFRNCSRLKKIDLSRCIGITSIIIPDNKNLETLILPQSITSLSLGYAPKLDTLTNVTLNNCKLTSLTIDAGNAYLMHKILKENIGLRPETLIINNVKNNVVWMPMAVLDSAMQFNYVNFTGTISVKETATSKLSEISWKTKELCAKKFGNIDSTDSSQKVKVKYALKSISQIKVAELLNIEGGSNVVPSYKIQLNGNDVKIDGNHLKFTYTLVNVDSSATIDEKTGNINTNNSPDGSEFTVTIKVETDNGIFTSNTCKVTIGFRVPKLGDFAYPDGSFSSYYVPSENPFGFVYYSNSDGSDVRVMSLTCSSTQEAFGPCVSLLNNGNYSSNDETIRGYRSAVSDFANQIYANILNGALCNENKHTGLNVGSPIIYTNSLQQPSTLTSGAESTAKVISEVDNFLQILAGKEDSNFQYTSVTDENYNQVSAALDEYTNTKYANSPRKYSILLYPAVQKAYRFDPVKTEGYLKTYKYDLGNGKINRWYIPSLEEVQWIIQNIVNSKVTSGTDPDQWKDTTRWLNPNSNNSNIGFFSSMNDAVVKATNNSGNKTLNNSIAEFLGPYNKITGESNTYCVYFYGDYTGTTPKFQFNTSTWDQQYQKDWTQFRVVPCISINLKK